MIGIYEIRNIINNVIYIGSSINVEKRMCMHRSLLNRGKHHSIKLQRAWNKYNSESFLFTLLKEVEEKKLKNEEQDILDKVLTNRKLYYNISVDATAPSRGQKITDIVKAKTSATIRLKFKDIDFKNKHKDAVSSDEVRAKMSAGATKRWSNIDNKVEQSERTTAWFSNPENRTKNSEKTKAFFSNPENRKAQSLRSLDKKISDEDAMYLHHNYKTMGTQQSIADRYGISITLVNNIIHNKRRQHIII